ncbi:MAG: hypothetical protein PHU40_07150 [Sulfurimonas sp.]|nr:hypothetical protein [Sulfurimonas sp.]
MVYYIDTYISNDIAFNEIFLLNTTLIAQKALGGKNLDASEDLSVGGVYGVKLYPDNEQSAENGYILSAELFTKMPNISDYTHKVGVFYDIADAYQEKNTDATFQRQTYRDVGLGYYANYNNFFAKTQMAWSANSSAISSENTSHRYSKFLFQAGIIF